MRLVVMAAIGLLSGCATPGSDAELPEYVRHPRTAYAIEGEVRDEVTFAPIPDAQVVVETDRPGYVATARADAGGRFTVGYSAVLEMNTGLWPAGLAPNSDADLVRAVSIRAEANGRCSPTHRFAFEDAPESGVVLLVGDCSRYRRRSRELGR
jgi:hypothetical protein